MVSLVKIKVDRSRRKLRNPARLEDEMKKYSIYFKEETGGEMENALYLYGPAAIFQY